MIKLKGLLHKILKIIIYNIDPLIRYIYNLSNRDFQTLFFVINKIDSDIKILMRVMLWT